MNDKLNEIISHYNNSLERKKRMIKRVNEERKERELNPNELTSLAILEAERDLLRDVIEDLQYIKS